MSLVSSSNFERTETCNGGCSRSFNTVHGTRSILNRHFLSSAFSSIDKMALTTQLKSGSWIVHWELNGVLEIKMRSNRLKYASANTTFTCAGHTYQLNFTDDSAYLTLDFNLKSAEGIPCGSYPKAIHVSLMGRVKSVNEVSRGLWGPVRWSNYSEYILPTTDTNYRYRSKWPVFQIFVEFPIPPGPTKPTCTPGERQVLSQLAKLLDSQALADVHFNIKGHQIVAHTAIVASGSPVFSAMFEQEHFKEASTKAVDIEDIEADVFQQMLRFLYAGVAPQLDEADMTEPLFLAADKYQIELLKEQCETSLIDKMDVSNAVRRLVLAYLHSAPNLMEAALKCLIKHKDEVWNRNEWKELMKSYQDLFYLAANRMVADRSCHCSPTSAVKV